MKLKIGIGCGGGRDAYGYLKALGYDAIDFALANTGSFWYTGDKKQVEQRLLQEKAWAEEKGMILHQCHGPWRSTGIYGTAEERKQRMEENKRSLWCASVLGIKNWVIHPIFPYGSDDDCGTKWDESFKINYDFYTELLETAKVYDITICYENMPFGSFGLSEVDRIKKMVDKIGDEHFKICLDTGHVNCFRTRNLGEAVRICGKDLGVLHVHDNHGGDTHELPFFGTADWDSFYEGLCDIGFDGVFNFETVPNYRMGEELASDMHKIMIQIAKRIMHYEE